MDKKAFEHRKLIQRREQSVQALFNELDNTELDGFKFLCEPYISSALLEDIRNGSELVLLLARKKKIDFEQPNFDFLVEVLCRVHRLDLVMNLGFSADNVRIKYGNLQNTNMIAFRCLLLSLSYDLTNENLEAVLEILRNDDDIGIGRLSRIKTVLDLFRLLMKEVKLKHDDFQWLTQIVDLIGRQDLLSKIQHHEENSRRSITFHASIDSMGPSYCYDTDRKDYKGKKMVFNVEEPLVAKNSAQPACVQVSFPYNMCSSSPPSLQGFNILSSMLGKQFGEDTQAKYWSDLSSQGYVSSVEHFAPDTRAPDLMDSELLSKMPRGLPEPMLPTFDKRKPVSSSIRVEDRIQKISPEHIASLSPQGATALRFFEQSSCNDPGVRNQMDREVSGGEMKCRSAVPNLPSNEKVKEINESKGETVEPPLSLSTKGSTLLGYTEDPSSGYVSSERSKQLPQPLHDRYTMTADPRGKCIIVNNQTFEATECSQGQTHERRGSHFDAERLMETFSSLKFKTELYNNLSAVQLVSLLSETANKDHTNFDCFVLCLLTHGRKGQVFGIDWAPVNVEDLTKYLQSPYCRSLAGKPKIIIIQACQGKKRQLCDDLEEDIVPCAGRVVRPTTNTGDHGDTADFVIVSSTCPGYSSIRWPGDGSFFIQTLVDVLNQYSQRWDFITILEDVNKKMCKRFKRKDGREYIQTPSHHSTLKAKIYFV